MINSETVIDMSIKNDSVLTSISEAAPHKMVNINLDFKHLKQFLNVSKIQKFSFC
jgi:hypothetical protein